MVRELAVERVGLEEVGAGMTQIPSMSHPEKVSHCFLVLVESCLGPWAD